MNLRSYKRTHFVLFRPYVVAPPPKLVIGTFEAGAPPRLLELPNSPLDLKELEKGLWGLQADDPRLGLKDGVVYHYFFEVQNSNPYPAPGRRQIQVTPPDAESVDWRLLAPAIAGYAEDQRDPAAVVLYRRATLTPCDPGGEVIEWLDDDLPVLGFPPNNQLVIYELPASWTRRDERGGIEVDVGTFRDVQALVERRVAGGNFGDVTVVREGAHLEMLGVNAIELTPPADSWVNRQWGYATSNYFAPDGDLGWPAGYTWSTPNRDLAALVQACHRWGIRFIADMAMGFANHCPWENINFWDFHVNERENASPEDKDEHKAGDGTENKRQSWGGQLFKYASAREGWDPITGEVFSPGTNRPLYPARRFMEAQIQHWVLDLHIDGIRMDSIKTVKNWDFVGEARGQARASWNERARRALPDERERNARFLVVGEILDGTQDQLIIRDDRLDGVWNEGFKGRLRSLLLGEPARNAEFEQMVREMIDCRNIKVEVDRQWISAFKDVHHVVNYVTSHDVEGYRNERLFNFLLNNRVFDIERRIVFAFACLLTAVGIPMLLAGEEFAEQHDMEQTHPRKQMDTINFARRDEPWRRRIFDKVARLVKLRTSSPALGGVETTFLNIDQTPDGGRSKRVVAWARGAAGTAGRVVVVANFSDWYTPEPWLAAAEYAIVGWPVHQAGWREVLDDRAAPNAGREPLGPWDVRVYVAL